MKLQNGVFSPVCAFEKRADLREPTNHGILTSGPCVLDPSFRSTLSAGYSCSITGGRHLKGGESIFVEKTERNHLSERGHYSRLLVLLARKVHVKVKDLVRLVGGVSIDVG